LETESPLIIIGVGNTYRGDDALVIVVARQLSGRVPDDVAVHENFGEVAGMMELFEGAESVILVDAVSSGSEAGKVLRFDASREEIPADCFRYSTHAFSIPEAVGLARALGQLPRNVIIYGIEGKQFETGEGLSPEVEKALPELMEKITAEIETIQGTKDEVK